MVWSYWASGVWCAILITAVAVCGRRGLWVILGAPLVLWHPAFAAFIYSSGAEAASIPPVWCRRNQGCSLSAPSWAGASLGLAGREGILKHDCVAIKGISSATV